MCIEICGKNTRNCKELIEIVKKFLKRKNLIHCNQLFRISIEICKKGKRKLRKFLNELREIVKHFYSTRS